MTDRVALVTGGGSGIGRAIALALADGGHEVVVAGRREQPMLETRDVAAAPQRVRPVVADVTDPADLDSLFGTLERLDLLVNNAGVFGPAVPLEEVADADWDDVLAVNVTAAFRCTQRAVRLMKRQQPTGGRIVNIGSVSAHRPRANSVAYAVSKHALTGLTRSTALEGREHAITCTQLDIGNAATAMTAAHAEATFDVAQVGTLVAAIAALPAEVSVLDATVLATGMPYLARG